MPKTTPITTIRISAKCSDLFSATAHDGAGKQVAAYDGYVPDYFPGEHYGDYVLFDIDITTGKILNWVKPSQKALAAAFKA